MKAFKVLLAVLLITVLLTPVCTFAESEPASSPETSEPQVTTQPEPIVEKVDIYVFSMNMLGVKFNKKTFPVFINGLLITSLDYSEYIHYQIKETNFKVATIHLEVSSNTKQLFSTYFVADTVYSEVKINDAKPGQPYYIEIQNNGKTRVKSLTSEEGEKKFKSCKEVSY